MTQPPQVSFRACEPGAMDARLLASTETDDGTVQSVGDTVGLGVLEREGGDDEVGDRGLRKLRWVSYQ